MDGYRYFTREAGYERQVRTIQERANRLKAMGYGYGHEKQSDGRKACDAEGAENQGITEPLFRARGTFR